MSHIRPNVPQAISAFRRAVNAAASTVIRAHGRPVTDAEIGGALLGYAIGVLFAAGFSPKTVRDSVESSIAAITKRQETPTSLWPEDEEPGAGS